MTTKVDTPQDSPNASRPRGPGVELDDGPADDVNVESGFKRARSALQREMEEEAYRRASEMSRPPRREGKPPWFEVSSYANHRVGASIYVQHLLWKRFLDARHDLIQAYLRIQGNTDQGSPLPWPDIDVQVERHCGFEVLRKFAERIVLIHTHKRKL